MLNFGLFACIRDLFSVSKILNSICFSITQILNTSGLSLAELPDETSSDVIQPDPCSPIDVCAISPEVFGLPPSPDVAPVSLDTIWRPQDISLHIPVVDASMSQPVDNIVHHVATSSPIAMQPTPKAVSPTVVAPVVNQSASVPTNTVEPAQVPVPCAFTPASFGYYGNSIAHSFGYSPYAAPPPPMYPAFMQQPVAPVAPVAPTPPKPRVPSCSSDACRVG